MQKYIGSDLEAKPKSLLKGVRSGSAAITKEIGSGYRAKPIEIESGFAVRPRAIGLAPKPFSF